jgi:competence ComEA-like helix-hairpin-helix protein
MKLAILFLSLVFLFSFVNANCNSNQININSASLSELENLAGIGPVKAQAIIDSRPFSTIDELDKVKGIGEVTLQKIKTQALACIESNSEGVILEENNTKNQLTEFYQNTEISIKQEAESVEITKEDINQWASVELNHQPEQTNESIINLISANDLRQDNVIYQSKNELVKKYSIYAFALFLVVIILILLIKG